MITLWFHPVNGDSVQLVRGTYFRICADGTLRGPDNTVTAHYTDGIWQCGRRRHRIIECQRPVCLRVTEADGRCVRIGPFASLQVAQGAIFSSDRYLGAYATHAATGSSATADIWQEIAILSDAAAE